MKSFPVLKDASVIGYPSNETCAECGASYDPEGEYAAFDCLTMLSEDESMTSGSTSKLNAVSVGLWHVRRRGRLEGSKLYIVKSLHGGHAMIFCCSTKCLRAFFNSAVDALEAGQGVKLDD
jgi:hypothetical protein